MYEVLRIYAHWSYGNQKKIAITRIGKRLNQLYTRKHRINVETLTPHTWRIQSAPFLWELITATDMDNSTGTQHNRRNVLFKYFGEDVTERYESVFGMQHEAYQVWNRLEKMLLTDWYN